MAALSVGFLLGSSNSDRLPLAFFDGEWLWVSQSGGYMGYGDALVPEDETLLLSLRRGRFSMRATGGRFADPSVDWTGATEGFYLFLPDRADRTFTGESGPPIILSAETPYLRGQWFIPQVRSDTLTLFNLIDDGLHYSFVRQE
ncbi:MAG: hypothetical protein ABMA15_24510 [Vicinamibacterales bacterium]